MFILITNHNSSSDDNIELYTDLDNAIEGISEFLETYGFEIKAHPLTGMTALYDWGNDDPAVPASGFSVFSNVDIRKHNGKSYVAGFNHSNGQGPQLKLYEK